jgi:hypothetical protein
MPTSLTRNPAKDNGGHLAYTATHNGNTYELYFWTIVGGTPALAFTDFYFMHRFDNVSLDPNKKNTIDAVGGTQAAQDFLDKYAEPRRVRLERMAEIPAPTVTSRKRFHSKDDGRYYRLVAHAGHWTLPYISTASADDNVYIDPDHPQKAGVNDPDWLDLFHTLNRLKKPNTVPAWEEITRDEFDRLLALLRKLHNDRPQ